VHIVKLDRFGASSPKCCEKCSRFTFPLSHLITIRLQIIPNTVWHELALTDAIDLNRNRNRELRLVAA